MANPHIPKRLDVTAGRPLTIAAPGHGIGGYVWLAEVEDGPGQVVDAKPELGTDAIGGGAVARFRLDWHGPERGIVKLSLKRPWEDEPIEVHRIEIEPAAD
jgi:hypothetical protein